MYGMRHLCEKCYENYVVVTLMVTVFVNLDIDMPMMYNLTILLLFIVRNLKCVL